MRALGVARSRRSAGASLLTGALLLTLLALAWATAPGAARGQSGPTTITPTPVASPYFTVTPPAPPPPLDSDSFTPGGMEVQPGGSVSFLDEPDLHPGAPSGPRLLKVVNAGAGPAGADYDGLTLVITGGTGYPRRAAVQIQVPGATCTPLDPDSARVGCTPISGDPSRVVTFTTSPLPDAQSGTPYTPVGTFQALAEPNEGVIAPHGKVLLLSPASVGATPNAGGSLPIYVTTLHNLGLDPVTFTDDGATLTMAAPDGNTLMVNAYTGLGPGFSGNLAPQPLACAPPGTPNVVTCPDPSPPASIDVLAEPTAAFTAPIITTLYVGDDVAFSTPDADLVIRNEQSGYEPPANAVNLDWDGTTLTATGPPRARVSLDCAPQSSLATTAGNSASCDLSQDAQTLVTVSTALPHIPYPLPAPPRPQWLPFILAAPTAGSVGDVLSFTGGVGGLNGASTDGPFAYFWDWGDGTIDTGADATHAYADAGSYNVTLVIVNLHDGTTLATSTTVTIAGP